MRILGIETSCDETSAAVLRTGEGRATLESLVILSQDVHRVYGGVLINAGRGGLQIDADIFASLEAGELYAATAGIGFMITVAGATFQTDKVFVGVLIFAISGMAMMGLLDRFEKRFDKWRPKVGAMD